MALEERWVVVVHGRLGFIIITCFFLLSFLDSRLVVFGVVIFLLIIFSVILFGVGLFLVSFPLMR